MGSAGVGVISMLDAWQPMATGRVGVVLVGSTRQSCENQKISAQTR